MLILTPWRFGAEMIRASGDLWARNLHLAQVCFDAALHQQRKILGLEHPVSAAGITGPAKPRPGVDPAAKPPARRLPAKPKLLPESVNGLGDPDVPV